MPIKDDGDIWERYAASVKRVKKTPIPAKPASKRKDDAKKESRLAAAKSAPPVTLKPIAAMDVQFTRMQERDLRDGDIAIDARLDLHGMTQMEAYNMLEKFIYRAIKSADRNLLIITGKGSGGEGVLKGNLRGWLETIAASQILAMRPAAPKHGGGGAFYVMLRRKK